MCCAPLYTSLLFVTGVVVLHCTRAALYVNQSGDILLGGLFPVHANGKGVTDCGTLQAEDGLRMLEAMLFAVKEINDKPDFLPGIRLGVVAYDTCDSPTYALEQSLDFIKGFIAHYNDNEGNTASPEFVCNDGTAPKYRGGHFDKVVAIIGEQSSEVTMQIATMLRLFGTPIVSYLATSPALSNRDRFPTLFRTVSSDENQARAMLELLRNFKWTYVSIVYSDTEYGNQGYETLQRLAPDYNVCFSTPLRISSQHISDSYYDRIINKLDKNSHARVVIVFAEKPMVVLRLVESTLRTKVSKSFVWIGSHGWTVTEHRDDHLYDSSPLEDSLTSFYQPRDGKSTFGSQNPNITEAEMKRHKVLEGALAIQPLAAHLTGFDRYFEQLTIENHEKENPWFKEYIKLFHNCDFKNGTTQSTNQTPSIIEGCNTMAMVKTKLPRFRQYSCLHFVRDAVYAVATALQNMYRNKCPRQTGLCENMKHVKNSEMIKYLANVTFNDEQGNPFRFEDGDGPPRYSILNFQQNGDSFGWEIVGNYSLGADGKPKLNLDKNSIKFHENFKEFPSSKCTKTCDSQQIRIREYDDTCCWSCMNCSNYEIRHNNDTCEACKEGFLPSENKTDCEEIIEDYIHYSHSWATPALIVGTGGVLLTLIVFYVFWRNAETPVVKASGRELSYILLIGTFIEFFVTYFILAPPTLFTCIVTRLLLGFSFTLCYAAIVTKTNRIARIFKGGGNIQRTRYISPISQISITAILTSVEIVIIVVTFWYNTPIVTHIYPTRDSRIRICNGIGDYSYLIDLFYPFILIGVCTVYAFLTRKCPDGFNETKHIGFTNYTAIVIWLAFVPLYIASTNNSIRMVTLAMSLSLSGFVQLSCLFLPKIYIILFTPEKNTKEVVMGHHHTTLHPANLSNNTPYNTTDNAPVPKKKP